MTKTKAHLSKSIAVLSASLFLTATTLASVVYDNTTSPLNRTFTPGNNVEFGDQVFLSGSERRITDFSFDYFLGTTASGNETGELFFYQNDGASGAPGTVLYRSGSFSLASGQQSILAPALSVTVPNTFTWAVAFAGIDFGEQTGLVLADPPSVGASLNDFWIKGTGGTWSTLEIDAGATAGNFAARITAVPEPTTFALGLLGGLAVLGLRRRRRS